MILNHLIIKSIQSIKLIIEPFHLNRHRLMQKIFSHRVEYFRNGIRSSPVKYFYFQVTSKSKTKGPFRYVQCRKGIPSHTVPSFSVESSEILRIESSNFLRQKFSFKIQTLLSMFLIFKNNNRRRYFTESIRY